MTKTHKKGRTLPAAVNSAAEYVHSSHRSRSGQSIRRVLARMAYAILRALRSAPNCLTHRPLLVAPTHS